MIYERIIGDDKGRACWKATLCLDQYTYPSLGGPPIKSAIMLLFYVENVPDRRTMPNSFGTVTGTDVVEVRYPTKEEAVNAEQELHEQWAVYARERIVKQQERITVAQASIDRFNIGLNAYRNHKLNTLLQEDNEV